MMIKFLHDINGLSEVEFKSKTIEDKISVVAAGYAPPWLKDKVSALESLKSKIGAPKQGKTIGLRYWFSAAAAVLVVALLSYLFILPSGATELVSLNGNIREFTLPDGSVVALNAGSKITYSQREFTSFRKLSLAGEAFFKVSKGSRFVVETKHGSVGVLGTQFNVVSRDGKFSVECLSGKVGVESGNKYLELGPGQQVKAVAGELIKNESFDTGKISSWKKGEFNFDNEPLVFIFEELERQFDVKFDLPDLKGRFYSGGFLNHNLEEALAQVCIPMGLNYETKGNRKVVVTNKK